MKNWKDVIRACKHVQYRCRTAPDCEHCALYDPQAKDRYCIFQETPEYWDLKDVIDVIHTAEKIYSDRV